MAAPRRGARKPRPLREDIAAIVPLAPRLPALDALRGIAILAMIVYHFCFDLHHFGLTTWDFHRDPFWLHARTVILSTFLLLAGASLALAQNASRGRARFRWHVLRIAACAVLVTLASYAMFPQSFIWFGVLHAIVLSLLIARPLAARPGFALAAGIAIIVAGNLFAGSAFDNRLLGWVGFTTVKPITEDYVPLVPWTGVLLVGVALGALLNAGRARAARAGVRSPQALQWLGRHSLAAYMIHQPILFGALFVATAAGLR